MKRIAIFVATTEGPVRVEGITREAGLPQSVVCLGNRTTRALPISGDYDAFVKQPTGVIEREFGPFEPGAFRLDVSEPIGGGESWKLAVFLAHALDAETDMEIAQSEAQADAVAWLTGKVNWDLAVDGVEHVPEKLHRSQDAFARWRDRGLPVTLFVPNGENLDDLRAEHLPREVEVIAAAATGDVLRSLGLGDAQSPPPPHRKVPDGKPEASAERPPPPQRRKTTFGWRPLWGLGALLVVVLGLFMFAQGPLTSWRAMAATGTFSTLDAELAAAERKSIAHRLLVRAFELWLGSTRPTSVELAIFERRPPEGAACAPVHFGRVEAVLVPIRPDRRDPPPVSDLETLCGLSFRVEASAAVYVATHMEVLTGRLLDATARPEIFAGEVAFFGRKSWHLDLPRRMSGPLEFRLVAVVGRYPVTDAVTWLGKQADLDVAASRLASRGITILRARHRVAP